MPESIIIGAFSFGAILILIAIVGGNFKLFGAEINSSVNRSLRLLAFLLGLGLVGFALFGGSVPPPATPNAGPPSAIGPEPPRQQPQAPTGSAGGGGSPALVTPASDPQQTQAPRPTADLAGTWMDNLGGAFQIEQQGATLSFEGYNATAGVRSWGTGEINGQTVTWTFETDLPSKGTSRMRLAADGLSAAGVSQDSVNGSYAYQLQRVP